MRSRDHPRLRLDSGKTTTTARCDATTRGRDGCRPLHLPSSLLPSSSPLLSFSSPSPSPPLLPSSSLLPCSSSSPLLLLLSSPFLLQMLSTRPVGAHGNGRGREGPAGDALAGGVGHRRAWPGGGGGARPPGEAGDAAAPTTTALGGPGCCSGGAGTGRGPPPVARGWGGGGLRRRGDGAGAGERLRRRRGPAAAAGCGGERKGMRGARARGRAEWAVRVFRPGLCGLGLCRGPRSGLSANTKKNCFFPNFFLVANNNI